MLFRVILFLMAATWVFSGCISTPKFCLNQHKLLAINADSLPAISLDFSLSKAELEAQLRALTSAQDQKKPLHFGLLINGVTYHASIHAAHAVKPACYGMPAMQHRSPQLEVNLNFPDKALIEGKTLIPLDSIPGYIKWYFPNDKPYGEKVVKLTWKPGSDPMAIEKTIDQLGKGYLKFYEKEAQLKFKKSLCELDSTEINIVRKKYPFELRLWVGDPTKTFTPVLTPKSETISS